MTHVSTIRVAARYATALGKADLEKWKKDLKTLTKIYRDMPLEGEEAYSRVVATAKLFKTFRNNFEEWVYKRVVPKGGESYIEKAVKKSSWDFKYTLDSSFLFASHGGVPTLSDIARDREKSIKRYQVAATKAFKDLEEYLGEGVTRRPTTEHFEVGGASVVIENYGRDDDSEGDLTKALSQLRSVLGEISRAGFSSATRGLTITIDFDTKEWDVNGNYNPEKDSLKVFPIGLAGNSAGTLTHEVGHRFWFKELPGQARAHWDEVMASRSLKISADTIKRFHAAVSKKARSVPNHDLIVQDDIYKLALPEARDLSDEAMFHELARLPAVTFNETSFDEGRYLDRLMSCEGDLVQLEEISDYGNTSPVEAFAECFRLWVTKGPNALGPWTQEFFRNICRAGGAKVAKTLPV